MKHCPCGGELESLRSKLGYAYRCTKCGTFSDNRTRATVRRELEMNLDLLDEKMKERRKR
jgi:tRNA(Ile2) C34 agmatinyltransferase TiaS